MFNFLKNKYEFKKMELSIEDFTYKLKNSSLIKDSINEITKEYLEFYNPYKSYLEKEISNNKKNDEIKKLYNHFIRINILYNEIYNYGYLMNNGSFFESYKKQKSFLENKLFHDILFKYISIESANQVVISIKLKLMLSILRFKQTQNIDKQQIEKDFFIYYKEVKPNITNGKNKKNFRMLYLIETLNKYIENDKETATLYLNFIYNFEYEKYKNKIYAMALQYTGLGEHPHITMPLSNDFKSFINEKLIISNKYNNEELLNIIKSKSTKENQEKVVNVFER